MIPKIYKPWLSRFKGTAAHEPYAAIAKEMGDKKMSCLQNVYINLERGTLMMRHHWRRILGSIEGDNLRFLSIDLVPCGRFPGVVHQLRTMKSLQILAVHDSTNNRGCRTGCVGLKTGYCQSKRKTPLRRDVYQITEGIISKLSIRRKQDGEQIHERVGWTGFRISTPKVIFQTESERGILEKGA